MTDRKIIYPMSPAHRSVTPPVQGGMGNLTVHDVAVFAIAIPRKPGVPWDAVERSDAFKNICMMIQALVDQEVERARLKEISEMK